MGGGSGRASRKHGRPVRVTQQPIPVDRAQVPHV